MRRSIFGEEKKCERKTGLRTLFAILYCHGVQISNTALRSELFHLSWVLHSASAAGLLISELGVGFGK